MESIYCISSLNSSLPSIITQTESGNSNVYVYVTYLEPPSGGGSFTVGIAWVGTVCFQSYWNINGGTMNGKGYR